MRATTKWGIFLLLAAAQFMVVLDISIVNVSLATIKTSLGFGDHELQWIVTAYAIMFGGFLLLGGRCSDLFGRKLVLLIGMGGFTLVSLLIGLSQSPAMLIVLRAVQGLCAALMSPAALSLVITTFTEGKERNKAFGFWTAVATSGGALGLLLGGVLTQYLSWRWCFFVNVPAGILVGISLYRSVPKEEKRLQHRHLDLPGAITVTAGLILAVLGLSQGSNWGWTSALTLGSFGVAVVLLVTFVVNELKSPHPLMPLSIFRNRNVTGANLMMAPIAAAMFGMFFLNSIYLQNVLHFTPLETGVAFLPFPVIAGFMGPRISGLVTRFGFRRFLILGPIFSATAIAWLMRLPVQGVYFIDVMPSLILMPIGMGMTFMPIIAAATSGVPPHQAGLASGLINTAQQMGGAVGLAVLTSIATSVATDVNAGASIVSPVAAQVYGYDEAFMGAFGFVLFALLLSLLVIRQPKKVAAPSAEAAASAHGA